METERMGKKKVVANRTLMIGDVFDLLDGIPSESVDVMITSPPYYSLRDYQVSNQFGMEASYKTYLKKLKRLMKQIHRILKRTGTAWVNLGDKYADGTQDVKRKSRYGIPERFYIDCIDAGWIARNYVIWHKANGKPEPYTDRLTNYSEPVLFFAKSTNHYFDLDAIRIAPKFKDHIPRKAQGIQLGFDGKVKDEGIITGDSKFAGYRNTPRKHNADFRKGGADYAAKFGLKYAHPKGSNPGNVWAINTRRYNGAHFATCLLYTSPSPRDRQKSRMPSSA